jgi:phospholipase/carboxylesterase
MFFARIPLAVLVAAAVPTLSVALAGCKSHESSHDPSAQAEPPAQQQAAEGRHRRNHRGRHRGEPSRAPAQPAEGSQVTAGLRYIEMVTGGANEGDTLPLVAFFHGHGGKPEVFQPKFAAFRGKARVILAYGLHPAENGNYEWFPNRAFRPEMQAQYAEAIPAVEATVADALVAIAKARPTVGKPIAAGFSQGAGLTLALALRHPDLLSAGCAMAGQVPPQTFDAVKPGAAKPELHAFVGGSDPNEADAKRSVESFKALGYAADIKVLPGFGHAFDPGEDEVFGCLDRAVQRAAASAAK